ncbi:MAG: hypothetical protein ACD_81C00219G0013 [uncultured bacterium]|uniref:DUF8128 domain-containing protein n=1 Tax=Candidatus Wolfebacteria bacterium GW2011_GWE2_44_13 TaxID=1619017 RepID=A0A0G1HAB3_9BACT|nr:MAG: hypothetical protein ACD_81C00219G0013 [uncultured bacterium]KKT43695.1 MAG: hypothetical protein UW32_C0001G0287 [Candidatus Wolfebacteria bacterium GW2011_GWE2_44_13]
MQEIFNYLFGGLPIPAIVSEIGLGILQSIFEVFSYVWWIVLPVFLSFYLWDLYVAANKKAAGKAAKSVVLELRIPKENLRSPKAMEQVFATLHGTYEGEIGWWDKNIKGKSQSSMSFEMVGRSGGVYFYIRVPDGQRNLVESALFAQYPNAEISIVDDYVDYLPASLPNPVYDVWGADLVLDKESAYPIKTYLYFEEKEEEQRLDPLTVILETMSKLRENEMIFLQYVIKATGEKTNDYKKKGQAIVDKMLGREVKEVVELGVFEHLLLWVQNFLTAFIAEPKWPEPPKKSEAAPKSIASLSFTEKEVLEGIEGKISKLCFEVNVRAVYIDRQESFHKAYISGITSAFKQFGSHHINSFKTNKDTSVSPPKGFKAWVFSDWKKQQEYLKKRAMFTAYKERSMIKKPPVFSIEELATLYHVPTSLVGAPSMRRIEAKKGEPPENLPIG